MLITANNNMYHSSPVQTTARTYVLILTIAGKMTTLLGKCIVTDNKRVSDCINVKTVERMTLYAVMEDWMIAYVKCGGFHAKIINETHLNEIKNSDKVADGMKRWIKAICNGVPTNKDKAELKSALSDMMSNNSKNTTTKLVKETIGGGRFQQTSTLQEPSLLEIMMINQARILNEIVLNYERLEDMEEGIPYKNRNERYKTDKKTKALQIKQENGEYREPKQPKDLLPDTQINKETGMGYIQLKDAVKVFKKGNKLNEFKAPSIFATVKDIVTGDAQEDEQESGSKKGKGNGKGEAEGNDEDKNNNASKKRKVAEKQVDRNANESESEESDEDNNDNDGDYDLSNDPDGTESNDDDDDNALHNNKIYPPETEALDDTDKGEGKTLEGLARTVCETIRTEHGNYKNNIGLEDKEVMERLTKEMDSTTSRLEKRVKEIMLQKPSKGSDDDKLKTSKKRIRNAKTNTQQKDKKKMKKT